MESKWEVGKKYLRVDGSVVTVIWTEVVGKYPIVAVEAEGDVCTFSATGLYWLTQGPNKHDLTTEEYKEPKTLWLNINKTTVTSYDTREAADIAAHDRRIGRVKVDLNDFIDVWNED